MYCIGLTGSIATGKSTVVAMLKELGAHIVDCDVIAREVVRPGTATLAAVAAAFGANSLLADGSMDRAYIGSLVFSSPEQKKKLEDILFPYIHAQIEAAAAQIRKTYPDGIMVLDMPLLYEIKYASNVNEVWLVYVDQETQLARLMARNGYSREEALGRIRSQIPAADKKAWADLVIDNSNSLDATTKQVAAAWQQLRVRLGSMAGRDE